MNKNRVESIDIFRGLGIIIMIMGHVYFGGLFDRFIHAFHMPMFYFVSGMFFRKQVERVTILTFVMRKVKTLIVPYCVFGLFHYLIWIWGNISNKEVDLLMPLCNLFWRNTQPLPIADALWFLTSLFCTEIIYFLMVKFIKSNILFHVLIIVLSLLGNMELYIFNARLPFAIGPALVGLGLYHIGHILFSDKEKEFVKRLFNLPATTVLACGGATTVLIFCNGAVNMRDGCYAVLPLFWLNAISSIIVGMNVSKWLSVKLPGPIKKIITFVGRNSIVYVCLNQLTLRFAIVCAYRILPNPLYKVLSTMLTLLLLGIGCIIINKTFLKKLIGR